MRRKGWETQLIVGRQAARERWFGRGWHDGQAGFGGGGDGFDLCLNRFGGGFPGSLPVVEAGAHLIFKRGPGCGEKTAGWIGEAEGAVGFDLAGGAGEEVELFAGAGGCDVENAAILLRFAFAID